MTIFSVAITLVAAAASTSSLYEPSNVIPPKPAREMRGAWIATIANVTWPSQKGLSSAAQKAEFIALLDRAVRLKLNTIIFQVRPESDAFYASSIEPWSEFLTGTMGKAPLPYYDPLAFAVQEAHARGLELHAWFNPYRARNSLARWPIAPNHVSKTHPQWVLRYGSQQWLDPGEKEVQIHLLKIVMDVVRRYDIDGVQFDDYFYPYPEKDRAGKVLDFPDYASWKRAEKGGFARDDWRRENVNGLIHQVYEAIKAAKPSVKFGISPFGIWRSGEPPQIRGLDAYTILNADSRKWLANGWVDYLAPQLYWPIDSPEQSFPVLLKWWAEQNVKGRNLFVGLDSTKTNERWKVQEILNQIRLTRQQSGVSGQIHWNMKTLMQNSPLVAALEREVYQQSALTPASPWLGSGRYGKPKVRVDRATPGSEKGQARLMANRPVLKASWELTEKPWLWLLQTKVGTQWKTEVLPGSKTSRSWVGSEPGIIAVTPIDRMGNASSSAVLQRRM